jgi:hypothetical protein
VAGRLEDFGAENLRIIHDSFRLADRGEINRSLGELATRRLDLSEKKAELSKHKHSVNAQLAHAVATASDTEKAIEKADPASDEYKELRKTLKETRERVATLSPEAATAGDDVTAVESLLESIDTFNAAIRTEPAGGGRSPLAAANMVATLREIDEDSATLVLLVKAQPGQSNELLTDRAFWKSDQVSTFVEVNVTYILVDVSDSRIVTAGTESAVIAAHGEFGRELVLRPSSTRLDY